MDMGELALLFIFHAVAWERDTFPLCCSSPSAAGGRPGFWGHKSRKVGLVSLPPAALRRAGLSAHLGTTVELTVVARCRPASSEGVNMRELSGNLSGV